MSTTVGRLKAQMDLSAPGLGTQISGIGSQFQRMRGELVSSVGHIHPALGTLTRALTGPAGLVGAGVGAAVAVGVAFKRLATESEQIVSTAQRLGMGTEFLERLQDVAGRTGTSFGTVTSAWQRMFIEISRAGAGGGKADIFGQLGLDVATLRAAPAEEAFQSIARSIMAIPDPVDRARYQFEVFGRSGLELGSVLNRVSGGMGDVAVVSERSRQRMAQLENQYLDLKRSAGAYWREAMVFALGWMASDVHEKERQATAARKESVEELMEAADRLAKQESERDGILSGLQQSIDRLRLGEEGVLRARMAAANASEKELQQLDELITQQSRLREEQARQAEEEQRIRQEEERRVNVVRQLREEVERLRMGEEEWHVRGLVGEDRAEALALMRERKQLQGRFGRSGPERIGATERGSAEAYSAIVQSMRQSPQVELQRQGNRIAKGGFDRVEQAVREIAIEPAVAQAPYN